ncbi:hypothetical protein ACN27G_16160 [Plantactinospora sp. WMMB334]|uniref:hypothetical protein n=1 Tax=Plantactinospora sp. WMMB334 TaxID=3404119 RepID=UPI003B92B5B1
MTRDDLDPSGDGHRSGTQVAREGAAQTGQRLTQAGGGLAHDATNRGRDVAAETRRQAQHLMGQATDQLRAEAGAQQQRAASGLRALGDELRTMSERTDRPGVGTDLVRHAAERVQQAAHWLDGREPGRVLDDVRDYARRNPGLFLAGAAVAGVIAGRLTRNRDALQDGPGTTTTPGGAGPHPDGMRSGAGQPGAMGEGGVMGEGRAREVRR